MRLLRLDLEKYGAFERRSLVFRPNARLHVVYGPNEAGKTTALAAVSDLLFGFGARTDFAFRHAMSDLRLGGALSAADGRETSFRRRKGAKATLVDGRDEPLRDDLLAPLLGALTREVFERAFGLSARGLREGGEDLLASDGESGASLFAAASGLRGVEDERRAIEGEADLLFRPQASTRRFNEEARRYDAARKVRAECELGASVWKRLNESIEALSERHAALDGRLRTLRTERARLERLARTHRAAASVDQARRELEAFGEAPEIDAARAGALARALDAFDEARAGAARAGEGLTSAEADVSAVALDEAALAAAEDIERVNRGSGAFRTLQTDLPRVQREADERDAALARLATRLGLADASAVEDALPTDAARAALRALIDEGRELARAGADRAREAGLERERIATLKAELEDEEPCDPRPLREALAALGARLKPLERRDEWASDAARETEALREAAARLRPPGGDLDALARCPLPGVETIARARKLEDQFAADAARLREAIAKDRAEAARAEADLAALVSDGPLASPDAIRAARAARDSAWTPLRAHLLGVAELDFGARAVGAAALERETLQSDGLADRAVEDAARVARGADLTRRRTEAARSAAEGEARLAALAAEREAAEAEWREAWAPAGFVPSSPGEMEAWRREVASVIERRERNGERLAAVARLDEADAALCVELGRIAAACSLSGEDGAGALALAARIDARLVAMTDRWQAAAKTTAQIGDLERRLARFEREEAAAAARTEAHRAAWLAALPAVGLARDASIAAAEAALAAWETAPNLIAERDNRRQRIRGMRRDAEGFAGDVARLVEAFAGDLADLPPEAAASRLHARLTAARAADVRRSETLRRREEALKADQTARRRLAEAADALAVASTGLPEGADLRALLARAAERERRSATLAERCSQLLLVGERAEEGALRAELEGFDPDAAPALDQSLAAEEERVQAEDRQVFAELDAERRRRDALGGTGAEEAAAEQRAAGAALAATAREWAVLKLAALLLSAAVERARQSQRSPTLERAADLFGALTGGAFTGFAEDYDKDVPRLVARRAGGGKVAVGGLSEGTRDQFYLALRLAFLEDYAARAEPAPFIADDLFASFDDARTAHGLAALAEIGGQVQPILFTHHRSVVETARAALGDAVDVVEFADA
ncbi:AAA family ATPase [Hansschlegelia sp. KR7-227]|uniref:ATP-binding protein n=1 Tax=Hansschlegelia sp. KR7-227 TaxID=3400914 RepID=UPI003C08DEC9